jgi:hypothetical protein
VELICYAHGIDFGAKGYGNLVEIAWLQRHVADALGRPVGRLLMIVKSAHVYQTVFGVLTRRAGCNAPVTPLRGSSRNDHSSGLRHVKLPSPAHFHVGERGTGRVDYHRPERHGAK